MDPNPHKEVSTHQAAALLLSDPKGNGRTGAFYYHGGPLGRERETQKQPGHL